MLLPKKRTLRNHCNLMITLMLLYLGAFSGALAGSRLNGIVLDPQDAPIAGALLTILNAQGTALQETVSDSEGNFAIADLGPGSYSLRIKAPHFKTRRIPISADMTNTEVVRINLMMYNEAIHRSYKGVSVARGGEKT